MNKSFCIHQAPSTNRGKDAKLSMMFGLPELVWEWVDIERLKGV